MTDWRKVCLALLQWFDEMEGTTYLYLGFDRAAFLKNFPPDDRPQIDEMLRAYHDKQGENSL
jgi:hypothetical protein